MLLNISQNDPKIQKVIRHEVGATFTLLERLKLKGIGSPKLHITSCSIDIHNLLVLDQNSNVCNIEMRPRGILVMFQSLLQTYALVIPYYKLNLYKGRSEEYSIHRDHYFIKIKANTTAIHKYMMKIVDYKTGSAFTQVEDMQ